MSKNIEIEAKYMVNEADFLKLQKALDLYIKDGFVQTNDYFDTKDKKLHQKKWMLRVRTINNSRYELTVKKPYGDGKEETNIDIDLKEYERIQKEGTVSLEGFEGLVLESEGKLTTHRNSKPYKDGEIFLDENHYNGIIDYEVEYEVRTSLEEAQRVIEELFKDLGIKDYKVSDSKHKRCCYNK
jgi:uncharacterized protein YjbK